MCGADRAEVVSRLAEALNQFCIEGLATNLPIQRFIAAHPDFAANMIDTKWLERVGLPEYAKTQSDPQIHANGRK